jgi:CheY-like chemotaxis protein
LSLAGFEVKVATNGTEGVDWAKTLRPHLIVMDLKLPGLDGWEATHRLKGHPETKHIPIIVVTSDTSEKSREKAFAAGCDEFETKPVNFEKLVGKIHSLLGRGAKA